MAVATLPLPSLLAEIETSFGLSKTEQSIQKIYEKNRMYLERELERFEPNALSLYDGGDNGYMSTPTTALDEKQ